MDRAEARRVLGIVDCPSDRCRTQAERLGFSVTDAGVETIPDDRTGECFFCGKNLVAPKSKTAAELDPLLCDYCGTELPEEAVQYRQRYCSTRCRKRGWAASPSGIDSRIRRQPVKSARKRERRAEARARGERAA